MELWEVGKRFRLPGEFYSYSVMKNGNINSTFKVTYSGEDGKLKSYVFQKINTYVFKNPVGIMENIDRVTSHIRSKIDENHKKPTLHYHHTAERDNYIFDEDGCFWRVMNFIDSITFNTSDDLEIIKSAGEAFGEFQMQLSDFDGALLHETIPDFHNTVKRMSDLAEHAKTDSKRVRESKKEIEYLMSVREEAERLYRRFINGEFPIRVTHNDTKANNVLFDKKTKEPLVVIDLDTVMPGMAIYDFGDAMRFIANTAVEDEPDISKVSLDEDKYTAFAKGYISQVHNALTKPEIDSLAEATFAITVELAARFLDDYITGDKYFTTKYPKHNLVRARCQIQLAKDIHEKADRLEDIVKAEMSVYDRREEATAAKGEK